MIFHPDDRSDDKIVTVTAKIWYVSDYLGKYRETLGYQKVDENCVDDEDTDEWCNRIITKAKDYEMFLWFDNVYFQRFVLSIVCLFE